jgi:hypothetical protein
MQSSLSCAPPKKQTPAKRTRIHRAHSRERFLSLYTPRTKPIMASVRRCVAALLAVFALAIGSADASAFLATDKTFDSAVLGSGKHAFVKFLAPWCVRSVLYREHAT